MVKTKHVINKFFLEVNTPSNEMAFDFKDNLDEFLKEQLFPAIERYFEDKIKGYPNSTLRFDKLELQISNTDLKNLTALKNNVLDGLKEKIDRKVRHSGANIPSKESIVVSENKSLSDAFFFFLKTGRKPWWQGSMLSILNHHTLKSLVSRDGFGQRLQKLLAKKRVRQRLINQFDDIAISLILTGFPETKKKTFLALRENKTLRVEFWSAMITYVVFKDTSRVKTFLNQMTREAYSVNNIHRKALEAYTTSVIGKSLDLIREPQSGPDLEIWQQETFEINEDNEGIFIDNAGIVLLHPFLKHFFIHTELANAKGNLLPEKIDNAIHLLHYLSTKKVKQPESELILEKFLCGCPLERPIERHVKLSEEQKQKTEELLQSVLVHWSALKNTSPDGLRTGFLQREGKLLLEDDKYQLIIARQAQDVLLDKIPWNIHIIKLPWLDKLLFVEW